MTNKTTKQLDPRNYRDGYHFNSSHWKAIRLALPMLPAHLFEIAVAMTLSDAGIVRTSIDAHMKFEQGYKQMDFIFDLFDHFKDYCFAVSPQTYIAASGVRAGLIKSYTFKTFSHPSFSRIYEMFYVNGVKCIPHGIVRDHMTGLGLAYWVMSDGSLQNDLKSMILHSQSFTWAENTILSGELNAKFGLNSRVIAHKEKYSVIFIPQTDAAILKELIGPHMIPYFSYKVPVVKSTVQS